MAGNDSLFKKKINEAAKNSNFRIKVREAASNANERIKATEEAERQRKEAERQQKEAAAKYEQNQQKMAKQAAFFDTHSPRTAMKKLEPTPLGKRPGDEIKYTTTGAPLGVPAVAKQLDDVNKLAKGVNEGITNGSATIADVNNYNAAVADANETINRFEVQKAAVYVQKKIDEFNNSVFVTPDDAIPLTEDLFDKTDQYYDEEKENINNSWIDEDGEETYIIPSYVEEQDVWDENTISEIEKEGYFTLKPEVKEKLLYNNKAINLMKQADEDIKNNKITPISSALEYRNMLSSLNKRYEELSGRYVNGETLSDDEMAEFNRDYYVFDRLAKDWFDSGEYYIQFVADAGASVGETEEDIGYSSDMYGKPYHDKDYGFASKKKYEEELENVLEKARSLLPKWINGDVTDVELKEFWNIYKPFREKEKAYIISGTKYEHEKMSKAYNWDAVKTSVKNDVNLQQEMYWSDNDNLPGYYFREAMLDKSFTKDASYDWDLVNASANKNSLNPLKNAEDKKNHEAMAMLLAYGPESVKTALRYIYYSTGDIDKVLTKASEWREYGEGAFTEAIAEEYKSKDLLGKLAYGLETTINGTVGDWENSLSGIYNTASMMFTGTSGDTRPNLSQIEADAIMSAEGNSFAGDAMKLGRVVGNMAPAAIASLATANPTIGAKVLAGQVYGSSYNEAKENYASDLGAVIYGIGNAGIEMGTNALLGGIDILDGGKISKSIIGSLDDASEFALKHPKLYSSAKVLGKMALDGGSEAAEEGLSAVLEPIWANISIGANNELFTAEHYASIAESAALGFFSAQIMNSPYTPSTYKRALADTNVSSVLHGKASESQIASVLKDEHSRQLFENATGILLDKNDAIATYTILAYNDAAAKAIADGTKIAYFDGVSGENVSDVITNVAAKLENNPVISEAVPEEGTEEPTYESAEPSLPSSEIEKASEAAANETVIKLTGEVAEQPVNSDKDVRDNNENTDSETPSVSTTETVEARIKNILSDVEKGGSGNVMSGLEVKQNDARSRVKNVINGNGNSADISAIANDYDSRQAFYYVTGKRLSNEPDVAVGQIEEYVREKNGSVSPAPAVEADTVEADTADVTVNEGVETDTADVSVNKGVEADEELADYGVSDKQAALERAVDGDVEIARLTERYESGSMSEAEYNEAVTRRVSAIERSISESDGEVSEVSSVPVADGVAENGGTKIMSKDEFDVVRNNSYSVTRNSAKDIKANPIFAKVSASDIRAFRAVGKALGVEVKAFDGETLGLTGTDGAYDPKTRTIYLNVTSPMKAISSAFRHEVIHYLKASSPKAYGEFAAFVIDKYKEQYSNEDYDAWLEAKRKEYEAMGTTLKRDGAEEEFLAQFGMDMLQQKAIARDFVRKHRSAAMKIWDAIRNLINKIRRFYGMQELPTSVYDAISQLAENTSGQIQVSGNSYTRSHLQGSTELLPGELNIDALNAADEALLNAFAEVADINKRVQAKLKNAPADVLNDDVKRAQYIEELWTEETGVAPVGDEDVKFGDSLKFTIAFDNKSNQTYVDISAVDIGGEGINSNDSISRKARLYLREHFRGTVLPVGKTKSAYIRSEGINEATNPAKYLNQVDYEGKMLAMTELDNLLKSSTFIGWNNDDGRHPDVKRWLNYKTTFLVTVNGVKNVLQGEVKIKRISKGDCFYDITKIKNITSDNMGQSIIAHAAQSASDVSNGSISDNEPSVNTSDEKKSLAKVDNVDGVIYKGGKAVAYNEGDGSVKFSLSTYAKDGKAALRSFLDGEVANNRLTKEDADSIAKELDEYYEICRNFTNKYASFSKWSDAAVTIDDNGDPVFSVVKQNGEYPMNLDFSLVCKKRRTLDAVLDEIVKSGYADKINLGKEQIVRINEMIREAGFETSCALCFVDAKRFRQADVADSFANMYNALVRSMVKGKDIGIKHFNFGGVRTLPDVGGVTLDSMSDSDLDFTAINKAINDNPKSVKGKIAKYLLENPSGRKLVNRGDFLSSKAFENLKVQNPEVLKLYNSKKGSGGPKAAFGDVQYLNEVIADSTFNAEDAYAVGGVRVQSFSDYIARLVFDYMQMTADLAAKKLPAHSYTKEVLFVKQFGLTGIKINMSGIPAVTDGGIAAGLDAEGNYVWADESFDYETAIAIQNDAEYGKNCGLIVVGVSDAHIRKLMADGNIRMIIPYHKSGLNPIVAKMTGIDGFTNYTSEQNVRYAKGENKGKKISAEEMKTVPSFNDALQRTDPKSAAEQHVRWCEDNGYLPKFDRFAYKVDANGRYVLDENGRRVVDDNYYKLLTDFAVYDSDGNYHKQSAVTMTFPDENSAFGSMSTLIEEGLNEDDVLEGKRDAAVPELAKKVVNEMSDSGVKFSKAKVDSDNVGYHAGDLGKAESLGSQSKDRSTGHFGRGTYFVGDLEKIKHYNRRDGVDAPKHAVDFSDYNLYKIKNDDDGYKLHNQLRIIDGGIKEDWINAAADRQFRLHSPLDAYKYAEEKYGEDHYSNEARIYGLKELAKKANIDIQTAEEFSKKSGYDLSDEYFESAYIEYLDEKIDEELDEMNDEYREFFDAYDWLEMRFGSNKVKQAMWKTLMYQNANAGNTMDAYKKDSLATVFMKALGYEGVDTRGTSLDNVEYGSVIYDIKKDTVKFSKSPITPAENAEYLELAKNPEQNEAKLRQMVDEAAEESGYTPEHLYHGTRSFGFTETDTSNSDDKISFFVSDNFDVASGYMPWYEDDLSDKYHENPREIGVSKSSRALSNKQDIETILNTVKSKYPEYQNAKVASDEELLEYFKRYQIPEMVSAAETLKDIDIELASDKVKKQVKEMCEAIIQANNKNTFDAWRNLAKRYDEFDSIDIPYNGNDMRPNMLYSHILHLKDIKRYVDRTPIIYDGSVAKALTTKEAIVDRYNDSFGGEIIGVYDLYANHRNQLLIRGNGSVWNDIPLGKIENDFNEWWVNKKNGSPLTHATTRQIAEFAKAKGYRSVCFEDIYDAGAYGNRSDLSTVYAFFHPQEDIKSADPVTYDNNGNIIPLSERFNDKKIDIRWSKASPDSSDTAYIPKGEKPARDINVPAFDDEGKPVSYGARTVLEAKVTPDKFVSHTMEELARGRYSHEVITDEDALSYVDGYMADHSYWEAYDRIVSTKGVLDKNDTALAMRLYNEAVNNVDFLNKLDKDGVARVDKLLSKMIRSSSEAGRTLQAQRLLKKMTPQGLLWDISNTVSHITDDMNRELGKWVETENEGITEGKRVKTKAEVSSVSEVSYDKFLGKLLKGRKWSKNQKPLKINPKLRAKLLNAKSENEAMEVYDEILNDLALQIDSTVSDKLRAWRYMAMLANPRTHIRNIVGNAVFAAGIDARNLQAALLEPIFVKKEDRRNALVLTKEAREKQRKLRNYAESIFETYKNQIKGESRYGESLPGMLDEKRVIFQGKYLGKVLEGISKKNSDALEAEDLRFLKGRFTKTFANAAFARGYTLEDISSGKVTDTQVNELIRYATMEAQKATYRDASKLASILNKVSREHAIWGFALDGVVPFKKTPINIVKRGIEYSPVSIIRGLGKLGKQAYEYKTGKSEYIDSAEIIRLITQGTTGTGLLAIGYFLAQLGILKGGDDEDKKLNDLKDARGEQTYSIELGGYSFTIDWAAPLVMPLFVGAELAGGSDDDADVLSAIGNLATPVLDTSMMSGIMDFIDTVKYSEGGDMMTDIFASIASSYALQYVPSFTAAIARTIDEVDSRGSVTDKTGTDGVLDKFMRKLANKSIIARAFFKGINAPYTDTFGGYKKKETAGDKVLSVLQNFVLPGYISEVSDTATTEHMMQLFDSTAKLDMVPGYVNKITVNGESRKLTGEEIFAYKTLRGEHYSEIIPLLTSSEWYNALEDDMKVEVLTSFKELIEADCKHMIDTEYYPNNKRMISVIYGGFDADDVMLYLQGEMVSALSEDSKKAAKLNVIKSLDISDDAKTDIYKNLFGNDNDDWKGEKADIDALSKVGVDFDGYLDCKIKKSELDSDDTLKGSDKATEFAVWAHKTFGDKKTEVIKDTFTFFNFVPAEAKRFTDFHNTGLSIEKSELITNTISALKPLSGADEVSSKQKVMAIDGIKGLTKEEKKKAYTITFPNDYSKLNYVIDNSSDKFKPEYYFEMKEIGDRINKDKTVNDGSGIANAEVTAAINELAKKHGLTSVEKGMLWQIYTGSSYTKNNPFDKAAGQRYLNSK